MKPLSRKLALAVAVLIVAVVLVSHTCSTFLYSRVIQTCHEATVDMVVRLTAQGVRVQDRAQRMVEDRLDEKMCKAMGLFQAAYDRRHGDLTAIDLAAIAEAVGGGVDLFVLDQSWTVVHTNFPKDLGLVIGTGDFLVFLKEVLDSGKYVSDRPMLSSHDGMKKFAYQATSDKKFLLEVGVALRLHDDLFEDIAFTTLSKNIVGEGSQIQDVELYAQQHSAKFVSINSNIAPDLAGVRLATATEAVQAGAPRSVSEGGHHYHYFPVASGPGEQTKRVVELTENSSVWDNLLLRHLETLTVAHLLLVALGIAFSLWIAKRLVAPLAQLSTAVRKIAAGDLDTVVPKVSRDEVGLLAADIDGMRQNLLELITHLGSANEELSHSYHIIIRAFFKALKHNESSTAEHSLRVNRLAMALGRRAGLTHEQLEQLEWGSLLHDIGKLAIPNAIIRKNGPLTPEERLVIETHPVIAFEMLKDATFLGDALLVSLHHQEWYDGTGYPHRLKGEEIPLLARICTVADAYEAMTTDRSYRRGLSHDEAKTELQQKSGTQFDPAIVLLFLSLAPNEYA